MSCSKVNSAVVTPVLAAGSTASPYYVQVNISQKLCQNTCAEQAPVFEPIFSLLGTSQVGTDQYVATVQVQGVICYVPCNGSQCCMKSQIVSQTFAIPFASTTAPTSVTISAGATVNSIAASGCQTCSRNFVSETPITLTVNTTE